MLQIVHLVALLLCSAILVWQVAPSLRRGLAIVAVVAIGVLAPAAAFAATPAAAGVIDFSGLINSYVIPPLTSALLGLASWAMVKAGGYFHVTIKASQQQLVDTAITDAIAYAQKLLAGKETVTTSETVSTAVNYLLTKAPIAAAAAGLGLADEHLGQMITAKLPA